MEQNNKFSIIRQVLLQIRSSSHKKGSPIPFIPNHIKLGNEFIPPNVSVAVLVERLAHSDLTIRAEAARRLGELGERAPLEPLLNALQHDEQRFVRAEAARALGRLGEQVPIAPLVKALHDGDGSVRVAAAQALGMLGRGTSLEDLMQALSDSWPPVREAVVLALGKLGEQVPLKIFLTALQDEDKFVRAAALSVLGTLGERFAISIPVDGTIPETASLDSEQHSAEIVAMDSRNERQGKSTMGRLVAWQPALFAQAHTPDWVRQNTKALVIVSTILGVLFVFSLKKRISSAVMDTVSRLFRLPLMLIRKYIGSQKTSAVPF